MPSPHLNEISHTYYSPELDGKEVIVAAMNQGSMNFSDCRLAAALAIEEAAEVSAKEGIVAAGPYFDTADAMVIKAMSLSPIPHRPSEAETTLSGRMLGKLVQLQLDNEWLRLPNSIRRQYNAKRRSFRQDGRYEPNYTPSSEQLLQHGHCLDQELQAIAGGYRRPYNDSEFSALNTMLLSAEDRTERLKQFMTLSLDTAWEVIMNGPSPLEQKARSGIVLVGGLVTCDEIDRAIEVAEITDTMLAAIDPDEVNSRTIEEFSQADEDERLHNAQGLSASAVLEITDEIKQEYEQREADLVGFSLS